MAVYSLPDHPQFPPPWLAEESGLLAVGGSLSPEWLIEAYSNGIFPWFNDGDPILWWSPDPRLVLFPEKIKISHSMKKLIRSKKFRITIDKSFPEVIQTCSSIRKIPESGTWITHEIEEAYIRLHHLGIAHSVEVWIKDELVGGLYGVSLGNSFFGESMFSKVNNASKAGFIFLVQALKEKGFDWIDCQISTNHLISLGAEEIPRSEFLKLLDQTLKKENSKGSWSDWIQFE